MRMGHVILAALCMLGCVQIGTPLLNEEQVGRSTNYIQEHIFNNLQDQYAFFVKFITNECNTGLDIETLKTALQEEKPEIALKTVTDGEIYQGKRLVAAKYKKEKKYEIHAESRLLNPPGDKSAPIIHLLQNAPSAGCVIFFSLNSPCLQTCTNQSNPHNIINKLNVVPDLPDYDNRAFAFKKLFDKDKGKPVAIFTEYWEALDGKMKLLRCNGNSCFRCFMTQHNLNPECYTTQPLYY